MQIETYEIEEINSSEASTMAADSEAIQLIEQLGLTGQQSLVNTGTATRFPYPAMTALQSLVFRANFPVVTPLKSFGHEIVPLRVLQVAAFCKDHNQTGYLEVWHTGISRKDPILVGRETSYSGTLYLLARWGDALEPFEKLIEKSRVLVAQQYKSRIAKIKKQVDALEAGMESGIEQALLTGEEPSFFIHG